jgi:hypothetical protein
MKGGVTQQAGTFANYHTLQTQFDWTAQSLLLIGQLERLDLQVEAGQTHVTHSLATQMNCTVGNPKLKTN